MLRETFDIIIRTENSCALEKVLGNWDIFQNLNIIGN